MKRISVFFSFFFLCSSLLYTSKVFAFVLLSGPIEAKFAVTKDNPRIFFLWDGSSPTFKSIESDQTVSGDENMSNQQIAEVLIQTAMDQWNRVPGAFVELVLQVSNSPLSTNPLDKVNTIKSAGSQDLSSSAFAIPTISGSVIDDCDITLSNRNSVTPASFVRILTHELGHCLGLGHNHQNYAAIMGYVRTEGYRLSSDDAAGVIYLYPRDGSQKSRYLVPGCGVVGASASQKEAYWWCLLLPLVFFSRRKIDRGRVPR